MEGIADTLVVVGLFLLRLGVPVALTVLVAYLFHRLDARWQAQATTKAEPAEARPAAAAQQPCWVEKGCSEAQRANCPACRWHDLPCWLARLKEETRLPAGCPGCARFNQPALVPITF